MPKTLKNQSMLPLINPNDKLFIKKSQNYSINDIVVLTDGNSLFAHRIIWIDPQKKYLITKGDNNQKPDPIVPLDKILGRVEEIKRKNEKIKLEHLYFSQSLTYLSQLKKIDQAFKKSSLNYLVLKGLPVYIFVNNSPPKRLVFDIDILVEKKDFKRACDLLSSLGFSKLERTPAHIPENRPITPPSQNAFFKKTSPFPVIVDLHWEPLIGFMRLKSLNKLIPKRDDFIEFLRLEKTSVEIEGTKYPILKKETLFVYLLIHLFQHNLTGAHRYWLLDSLVKKGLSWTKVIRIIEEYQLGLMVYPGLILIKKHFRSPIPRKVIKELSLPKHHKFFYSIILKHLNPFEEKATTTREVVKRFLSIFIFSPIPLAEKSKLLLNREVFYYFLSSIKPFLFNSTIKESKSSLALPSDI